MSQVIDIPEWIVAAAPPASEPQEHGDAEFDTPSPIPPLPLDRRRRSLPRGRNNDRYTREFLS